MNTTDYDAVLDNWVFFPWCNTVAGEIYGDKKERFEWGEVVKTSVIHNPEEVKEGGIIITQNNRYLLLKEKTND